jgi:hypothetical protein
MEVKRNSCYEQDTMPISKLVQIFISKKMVEEHCYVHYIKIRKGNCCIVHSVLALALKGGQCSTLHLTTSHKVRSPITH